MSSYTRSGFGVESRSDAFLRDVMAKDDSPMGLSSFMPAWKGILKDNQIQDLIDYSRSLARPSNWCESRN